jgi:hypothetical protein
MGNYVDTQRKILPKSTKKISNNNISTRFIRYPIVISDQYDREYVFYASSLNSSADITVSIDTGLNINVLAGTANHNDVATNWNNISIELNPGSFNYIVVNNLGEVTAKPYFEENLTLLAVAITTVSDVTELYNFPEKGEYILAKLQLLVDGEWVWTDQSPIHIISSGKYPNATYNKDTNILILTYLKDSRVYKREIDLSNDISEYQYIRDYVIVGNTLSLNEMKRSVSVSTAIYSEFNVDPINVIKPVGITTHGFIRQNEEKLLVVPTLVGVGINYFEITHIIVYDSQKLEVFRLPYNPKLEIDMSQYPNSIYYMGFIGEYSYFNKNISVTAYLTPTNSLTELDFTDDVTRLENLNKSSTTMGTGDFQITRTIEYINNMKVDDVELTGGAMSQGSFEITRTIEYINAFERDAVVLNGSSTGQGSMTVTVP